MAQTFDFVCPETGKAIWVGQRPTGSDRMYLYSTPEHLLRLAAWLQEHQDKPIFFVAEGSPLTDDIDDKNWVGLEDEE